MLVEEVDGGVKWKSGMSYTVVFNPVQWPELMCIVKCTDIYKLQ